ncbi:hypothetical protein GCM10011349_28270 [Novosphingobium indicum]|uniref:Large ribosomal subunit protein bL12 C-terminal domain-containing protein n=1 Tax=Novosphingobium indicum TaxID=462949 RepID=A0ABQ2JPR4_9SPHN|nr:ribosomal protein L7/L12 [Novosphingobium indicum]GGN53570.1 hypothetical protein GCM10011349_28270 [Novosphingobium indicum]
MMSVSWALVVMGAIAAFVLGWIAGRGSVDIRAGAGRPMRNYADLGPAIRTEIETAVADGRKIEAIKLMRDATGMGLKEAKEAVEAMDGRCFATATPPRRSRFPG